MAQRGGSQTAAAPLYLLRLLQGPCWKLVAAAGVAATILGFYQRWAELDIMRHSQTEQEVSRGIQRGLAKSFGIKGKKEPSWIRDKKKPALVPTRITGAMIPTLAHRKNVKVLLQLAALFTRQKPQQDTLGVLSYTVYAAPGLALLLATVLTAVGARGPWPRISVALVSGAIALVGCVMLLTSHAGREYGIVIGSGLWLTLAGYGLLALAAAGPVLLRRA